MGRSPSKKASAAAKKKKKAAIAKKKAQAAKKRLQAKKKKAAEALKKQKAREKKKKATERAKKQKALAAAKKKKEKTKQKEAAAKKKKLEQAKKKKEQAKLKAQKEKDAKKAAKENKPKRARSAYTFFVSANRASIQAKNPSFDFKELAKAVAEEWRNCKGAERAKFEEMARKDKLRSEAERAAFKSNKPKRAMSAYMFFVKENRKHIKAQHPEMTFAEVGKALGHAWKHCNQEHRTKYYKLAEKDKARAEKERAMK